MKTLELTQNELMFLTFLMEDLKNIPINEHGTAFLNDTKRNCTITVIGQHLSCIDSITLKINQ